MLLADASLAEQLARLPAGEQAAILASLGDEAAAALVNDWGFWQRPSQAVPPGPWRVWLVLAGRGFGKTRMGAEWVRAQVEGPSPLIAAPGAPGRIALVGETAGDVREVMLNGESGLLPLSPAACRPRYEPSRRRLEWPNGVVAQLYSAVEPDQLRGPQFHLAWADEIAKWPAGGDAWSNLMFGLRLGALPRVMATTTPRPLGWLKALATRDGTHVTRGRTHDNRAHLSPSFLAEMDRLFAGTRLGRQELEGEFIEDVAGALWSRDLIEACREDAAPPLVRLVVAVDPPVTAGPAADACGIVLAGLDKTGRVHVLADETLEGASPHVWASRAVALYHRHEADRLVAEVNQGGDLVRLLISQLDATVAFRAVRASRGKIARAEPVAALYERGMVAHAGRFPALEDQMCRFTGAVGEESPDRLDALVWAITDLALGPLAEPRIGRL